MDLENDIKVALNLLEGKENVNSFGNYNLIKSMTSEKLDMYFKYFPIKEGNVLTVLGSGDSLLQSVCEGARKVYAFDYNPLTFYLAKLKVTAIKYTSLDKFRNYFFNEDGKSYFNIGYYKSLKNYLDNNPRTFWDAIYNCIKSNPKLKPDNLIVSSNIKSSEGFCSYLNSYNYLNTKNRLYCTDINYYYTNIYDILSKLPDDIKFDVVFLSNIFDKMDLKDKVKYPLFIKKDLCEHLNDNAMVAVYSSINSSSFNALNILFEDIIDIDERNKVIVYKK